VQHGSTGGRVQRRRATQPWGWLCLGLSLCVHAALLLLLPGLASPRVDTPQEIIISLVAPQPSAAVLPQPPEPAADPLEQPALPQLAQQQTGAPPAPLPQRQAQSALQPAQSAAQLPQAHPQQGAGVDAARGANGVLTAAAGGGYVIGSAGGSGGDGEAGAEGGSGPGTGSGGSAEEGEGTAGGAGAAQPQPASPKPAAPRPSAPAVDVKALLSEYASGVKSAILREKAYPSAAEQRGHEGAVKVSFTVSADGGLKAVSVKASSGYDELDEAALSAVRDAAPFAPIPPEAGRQQLSLSITLRFSLN